MKSIKTIFILCLLHSSIFLQAQWIQQNSGTINDLYEVYFPVQDTGYVVGYYGTILKTTDGGTNWISLNSGTNANLQSVYFVDADIGFAVGDSGIVLKTTDGGANWLGQVSNTTGALRSVFFIDTDIGFAAGNYVLGGPVILKTIDGGNTWSYSIINNNNFSDDEQIKSIYFAVPDTGFAVYSRGVFKTTDAGNTWNIIAQGPVNTDILASILGDCYFIDANTGFVVGWYSPLLAKTINGGINWLPFNQFQPDSIYFPGLFSIDFPDDNIGYGVGWRSVIVKTIDAGNNWIIQSLESLLNNATLYSVHFTDTNTGYIVGENGTILKTDNGGSVGISEVVLENKQVVVSIYPNPNSNEVIVKMNIAKNQNVEIRLLTLSGQVLYEEKPGQLTGAYQKKIDLQGYAKGIYYLQIITDTEVINKKVVLE